MAYFIDDFTNLLVSDPEILDHFSDTVYDETRVRILEGDLPMNIDEDVDWLRWTIEDVEQTFYAGQQQAARSTYVVILDVLGPDANQIKRTTDWLADKITQTQRSGNIHSIYMAGKSYGIYEDRKMGVGILTLRVVWVN